MNWQNTAFIIAGIIGCVVAVIHGILTQRLMIAPIEGLFAANSGISAPIRRLVPLLLQFSTFNWFIGGAALIAAALWFGKDVKIATGLLVGSSYLFGALGNLWGTRALHPGWMLYTIAVALIAFGIAKAAA